MAGVVFFEDLSLFESQVALIQDDRQFTYADLVREADAFASRIGPTRRLIFLEARNTIEAVTAYVGSLRAGHVVYLFGEGDEERFDGLIKQYRPNMTVRHKDTGPSVIEHHHDEAIALHPELAVLLSTSGSTGSPKFVKLSRRNIESNARAIVEYLGLDSTERAVTTLKFNYSYGMSVINSHLICGACLVLTDKSVSSPGFWQMFEAYNATSFAGVPYVFEMLDRSDEWTHLSGLRYVTQAGGRLAPDIVSRMARHGEKNGWRFIVMYGQTEAAPRMAYLPPDCAIAHPDAIGRAIPGGTLSLIDEAGTAITAADTSGELIYSGPNVMMGYASQPSALATDETPPFLKTGDIAVRSTDGLFRIVGRSSRFIKPFGIRVNLDELQDQVRERQAGAICTGTDECLVIGLLRSEDADVPALSDWISQTYGLPPFMIEIVILEAIPQLSNGKTDYQSLISLAATQREQAKANAHEISREAESGTAGRWGSISAIFSTLIGASVVTGESTFVGLAGDSLSYVVTSLAIEEYLGFLPAGWETKSVDELEKMQTSKDAQASAVSLHYLNAGRVLMLLLGIPYHASMIYDINSDHFFESSEKSLISTIVFSAFHSFRMPTYFFISGFFSLLILQNTKIRRWLGQQIKRLGLPLLAGGLLLTPLEMAGLALFPERTGLPPWEFWKHMMTTTGAQWLSARWFLATLIGLFVCNAVILMLIRRIWRDGAPARLGARLDRHPLIAWILLLAGAACISLASSVSTRLFGQWSMVLGSFDLRSIVIAAPSYFAGAIIFLRPNVRNWYLKPSRYEVALTMVMIAAFVALQWAKTMPLQAVERLIEAPCALMGTRVFLSLMYRVMNKPHILITRMIDASYIIYIWHMVFVLFFNDLCRYFHLPPLVSIALTTVGAFSCSWLIYLVVRRSRWLSLLFNGGPLRAS